MSRRRPSGASAVVRGVAGAGLVAGAWLATRYPGTQRLDVRLGDDLRRAGSRAVDRAVAATTDLGSIYAVLGMAATLAAGRRTRVAGDVLGVGLAAWTVSQAGKTRVRRQRPYEADGVRRLVRPPTGSSFPSGHAAVGVAVTTVLADRAGGAAGRRLLGALAAYVPVSRVYVGVHYPTDVIGGAGLGLLLAAAWRGRVARVGRAPLATVARALAPGTLGRPAVRRLTRRAR